MSDNIIQLNEAAIKGELKDLVRNSVEETLNALLDHEADELVNAERYERKPSIIGTFKFYHIPEIITRTDAFRSNRANRSISTIIQGGFIS